jgi:hypothetical protein
MNPFQGQYPNSAVRITTAPINPITHRKTPEVKKTRMIRITPVKKRNIASPFPTFFTLATDSISPPDFECIKF